MRMDRRLLGWGMFFILVGAIPLLTRANYLAPEVVGSWPSLWPVLLIAWGLGLLLRGTPVDWIGGGLAAITFGLMGGGLLATGLSGVPITTGCGGTTAGTAFATQTGSLAGPGRVNVALNCGTLTMQPTDGTEWSVAGTESEGRAPRVRTEGTTLTIDDGDRSSLFDGASRTDWTVSLPRGQELGLGLTINAGEGRVDLDGAILGGINATVNAGSIRLDLGGTASLGNVNATVNLGSAVVILPAGARSINLSANGGNLQVCLPAGTSVRVSWSGALGSNGLDEAGLVKVDNNTWESPELNILSFVDLRVSANAGSFRIDLDGTCDA